MTRIRLIDFRKSSEYFKVTGWPVKAFPLGCLRKGGCQTVAVVFPDLKLAKQWLYIGNRISPMETKCAVCNQGVGYVLCDECGNPVCFNCFRFANSRRLCTTCVKEWEAKRRWQKYAEDYARMPSDEKTGLWAALSPEERLMLESEVDFWTSGRLQSHGRSAMWKYTWLAFPILGCLIVVLLFSDRQLWKEASATSKKLESEVGSLAGSVKREVVDLASTTNSVSVPVSSQQPAAIQLVGQKLRTNGLPVTAGNLRMKINPAGEGTIVYSPHYFGPNRRLAWIVIDGQAYSLTETSKEMTPSLGTSRAIPAPVWKKTGLSHEKALSELESSLWE